jgi:hypothetical protein
MGFKIIGSRDTAGNFIASADAWPEEKITALFDKYNPNRHLRLASQAEQDNQKEDKTI